MDKPQHSNTTIPTVFTVNASQWEELMFAIEERPPRDLPHLRALMRRPSPFR